jgi:hypothetical protein
MFLPDPNPNFNLNNDKSIKDFFKKWKFWKYFHSKPYLASLFHKPSNDIPNSKFIIEEQNTGLKKYRLLEMGPSFYQAIGGFLGKTLPTNPEINEVEIVLQDYDNNLNPFQKYILIIFGSLQMFIGSLMTLFSSVAYLFSGKHGMFFNMPFEKKINEFKDESSKMFKQLNKASILKSGDDKILIKSGWSKFAAAFGFAYFIPVDKLTYGTQFYVTDRSSFIDRFQYFFFIMLIMLFIGTLPSAFQGGSSGIAFGIIFGIIMYMIFAKRIYNKEYQTDPFPNMSSLLDKYRKYYRGSYDNKKIIENNTEGKTKYNRLSKEYGYDDLSNSINIIQEILQKEIVNYSKAYEKVDEDKTLEPNEDPYTKKLRKAKEFKNKVGEGVSIGVSKVGEGASKVGKYVSESKVGKYVSEKYSKMKERFGKKTNVPLESNNQLPINPSLNQPPEYHPSINHKIKKINSQIKGFQNDINKIKLKEKISDGNKAKINGLIKIIDQFKKRKQEIINQNPKIEK